MSSSIACPSGYIWKVAINKSGEPKVEYKLPKVYQTYSGKIICKFREGEKIKGQADASLKVVDASCTFESGDMISFPSYASATNIGNNNFLIFEKKQKEYYFFNVFCSKYI